MTARRHGDLELDTEDDEAMILIKGGACALAENINAPYAAASSMFASDAMRFIVV